VKRLLSRLDDLIAQTTARRPRIRTCATGQSLICSMGHGTSLPPPARNEKPRRSGALVRRCISSSTNSLSFHRYCGTKRFSP
jgi:hypothetical protein